MPTKNNTKRIAGIDLPSVDMVHKSKTEKELRAEQLRAELAELEDESTQRAKECGEKISEILKEYDCKIVIGSINIIANA